MKTVYFTAAANDTATLPVAHATLAAIKEKYRNVGVFRAFTNGPIEQDAAFQELFAAAGGTDINAAWGTTRDAYTVNEDAAMRELITRFARFTADNNYDAVIVFGLLAGDPLYPGMLARTGRAAAHLGTSVLLVQSGAGRSAAEIANSTRLATAELTRVNAPVAGIIVTETAAVAEDSAAKRIIPYQGELSAADREIVVSALEHTNNVVTPLHFSTKLLARARANRQRIVLPEASDERILRAAGEVLAGNIADVILLGDAAEIHAQAEQLGVDVSGAEIVSPQDPQLLEKYATEFAKIRAKKGVTYEQALETMADLSYFATMMVQLGDADGMVSGAIHTTANTIVPSFQIIKTKPGLQLVSSAFLMLMDSQVYVYADCAVTPAPDAEQLASIAVSAADTAIQFGIEPRVAMLSYSTGSSGKGASVEAVAQATELAKQQRPELAIDGPIQYDAAVDPKVGAQKLPGSPVAGQATVFIFPSLDAGNIGYKAVQRSSGAIAVGPILQGLNKPVNDLSRGALVADIVNTVAITAIQAQG
ncbi:MAG: phosphate acetyltransferase [Trueperella sp.]|nr:phosphate acetyltransferase [Trueperella sp.]